MQKTAYLSLGSNLGDRAANIGRAIEALSAAGEVARISHLYETEPVELTNQPWFLNCAVELKTEKMPRQLLRALLQIERGMGRKRSRRAGKGPRSIDLDIVLYGSVVMATAELIIPHPAMHERRFVLAPLAEIAPTAVHPVLKRSVAQLLALLPPQSGAIRPFLAGPAAWAANKHK